MSTCKVTPGVDGVKLVITAPLVGLLLLNVIVASLQELSLTLFRLCTPVDLSATYMRSVADETV